MIVAPAADCFPAQPASWYYFCRSRDLGRQPFARELLGRRLVGYRTGAGRAVLLDGVCGHFGGDLGQGCVIDDRIRCPFHNWEYGPDGRCEHIPAQADIPAGARQAAFPVVERLGFVFFFNRPEPLFPLPFFEGCDPDDFTPARPFETFLRCPWYLVGANAFDLQHFRAAHERRLTQTPIVECPGPFARRVTSTFTVSGTTWPDRITRLFAGDRVTMAVTDWCGNMSFVTATFRRTRSYGMVITEPTASGAIVRIIVHVPRSRGWLGRLLKDPIHAAVRRYFIQRFVAEDAQRLDGARYHPLGLIDADRAMADYFRWLAIVAHGRPAPVEEQHAAAWGGQTAEVVV
ncbi:MAG: Rieske 2Fe-2S domain-containing protein [Planctomycetes bacterium]|nr:Rieske 2Fe-2S domain-containing protein [Planctomycetota bacterium]